MFIMEQKKPKYIRPPKLIKDLKIQLQDLKTKISCTRRKKQYPKSKRQATREKQLQIISVMFLYLHLFVNPAGKQKFLDQRRNLCCSDKNVV